MDLIAQVLGIQRLETWEGGGVGKGGAEQTDAGRRTGPTAPNFFHFTLCSLFPFFPSLQFDRRCTHISQIRPIMQSGPFSPHPRFRTSVFLYQRKSPLHHSSCFKEPDCPTDVHSDPSAAIGAAAAVAAAVWISIRRSLLHARLHVV